jgi:hypothetical protein
MPENMVFMPFCCAEAASNLLTNPALDPFGKIPEFCGRRRPRSAPRRNETRSAGVKSSGAKERSRLLAR